MADKLIFSWQDIEADCKNLINQLKNTPIDLIVAITKGGLPIATILSNKYLNDTHIITLQLEEISNKGQANYQANKVKLISPLNTYPIKNKNVLLIDDVADSGSSLKEAIKLINKHQPAKLTTATLHYKPRSHTKPDIFSQKIENDVWIVYPWEPTST